MYSMPTLIRCIETRTAAAAEMVGDSEAVRSPVPRVSVAIPAKNPRSSSQPRSQRVWVTPSGAGSAGVASSRIPDAIPQDPASRTVGCGWVDERDMV